MQKLLRPISLELEGFQPFKERQVFKFDGASTLITGKRINSPVTSGTGKSAVVQGFAYILDFCKIPATGLKNYESKKIYAKLSLSDGLNIYEIIKSPKLGLTKNGVAVEGLSSAIEKEVKDLLKASPDVVEVLTQMSQRSLDDRFVRKSDGDKKDFLAKIIPELEAFERASLQADTDYSNAEKAFNSAKSNLNAAQSFFNTISYDDLAISEALNKSLAAEKDYKEAVTASKAPQTLIDEIATLRTQIQHARSASVKINQISNEILNINNNLSALVQEIDHMSKNACFTCHQPWENNASALEAKKKYGNQLLARKTELQGQVPALHEISIQETTLQQSLNSSQNTLNGLSTKISEKEGLLNANVAAYKALNFQKESYFTYKNKIHELETTVNTSEEVFTKAKHAQFVFGKSGFPSVIFAEILREIEVKANDLMGVLDNVANLYLRFDTISTAKNGNVKKNISLNITSGNDVREYKILSGGQQCAIELCVDIAISEVVKRRTGSPLGWIILDEAMDGFDVALKKAAIEALKPKINGTIIVIDHSTEIKESFESVIEVLHDGKQSWVA
jgi:DNA repair exonuclease SbcCD ATPase subunit